MADDDDAPQPSAAEKAWREAWKAAGEAHKKADDAREAERKAWKAAKATLTDAQQKADLEAAEEALAEAKPDAQNSSDAASDAFATWRRSHSARDLKLWEEFNQANIDALAKLLDAAAKFWKLESAARAGMNPAARKRYLDAQAARLEAEKAEKEADERY